MDTVFIIGMAGSGKSQLTAALRTYLDEEGIDVLTLNLDPAVRNLPYVPDLDVRDYVSYDKLMEEQELGPNAALVAVIDQIALEIERIEQPLLETEPQIVLIDTPGQLELFAFRQAGTFIMQHLHAEHKAVLYIFDAIFSRLPHNFTANLLLSTAAQLVHGLPQINVLNKVDMLEEEQVEEMLEWAQNPQSLSEALLNLPEPRRVYFTGIHEAIDEAGLYVGLVPVSALTLYNISGLYAEISRLFYGGEMGPSYSP
ncbi:ATP/GTP-binding protein [archaeon]|nr:ATP/GTP-binding protein [archaeon]